MNLPVEAEVVIVGAGPSGLMAAVQLLRHGVRPVIIDSKTSPVGESRAIAIQARSLEIFRQTGIVDRFLREGNKAECFVQYEDLKEIARIDYAQAGAKQTAFPFVLLRLYQ